MEYTGLIQGAKAGEKGSWVVGSVITERLDIDVRHDVK